MIDKYQCVVLLIKIRKQTSCIACYYCCNFKSETDKKAYHILPNTSLPKDTHQTSQNKRLLWTVWNIKNDEGMWIRECGLRRQLKYNQFK